MSCNGCRVLRKGCSESCVLRPCLQWIDNADAQGHATVFVAKFFGRSGLMGFISAVPPNQRPAVFQSLLYEACGRTVNPVFGAVGLLWGGNWPVCQAAVETVLKGGSLRPPSPSTLESSAAFPSMVTVPFLAAARSEKSAPTEVSGLSLTNEKVDGLKRARDVMLEGVHNARCGTVSSHPTQMHADHGESRAPEVKDESQDLGSTPQWQWQKWNQQTNVSAGSPCALRIDFPHGQQGRNGSPPAKEERDNGPLVLAPVARRVRPRLDGPHGPSFGVETSVQSVNTSRANEPELENLELDLTLSSSVSFPRHRNVHSVKRVSSPNSSESVNSEGSVTSLDSTCDLSLAQVPVPWKLKTGGAPSLSSNKRKALSLFASP